MPARSAIVIGAGHNGLVAAALLADAGWDVCVLEAQSRLGGAVHSSRALHPDFVTDWFSAFYPLAAASPVLAALDLHDHGLHWTHAPAVLAHVFPDDRCALLAPDLDATARSLDRFAAGDGEAWVSIVRQFERIEEQVVRALLTPFPPVRHAAAVARRLGTAELLRLIRFAVQPVRRTADELFTGEGGPLLLAGNALHTDLPPEAAGSGVYGWLLCMLGQTVGFPVPVGGAGCLVEALARRAQAAGAQIRLSAPVRRVEVAGGRAQGVRLGDGEFVAADAVLADVSAPQLYLDLVEPQHLPARVLDDIAKFQWDSPTMKLDWALSRPIPWTAADAAQAGTVHLGVDMDGLTRYAGSLVVREMPADPFVLLGQMTTSDPTRSPAGTESAWAYTHIPIRATAEQVRRQAERVEEIIDARAPGFADSVLARRVQSPADLQQADANLHEGAVGGGTSNLHQQLIFRPIPGLGRAETPVDGLYLASASAHPGGGVHGAPGANAARAALSRARLSGPMRRRLIDTLFARIYR